MLLRLNIVIYLKEFNYCLKFLKLNKKYFLNFKINFNLFLFLNNI
jgi:hypothetical protein